MNSLAALLLTASLSASSLAVADPMVGPAEFGDYARGWTLYFEKDGEDFGAESFDQDEGTIWRDRSGRCISGHWRGKSDAICFLYEEHVACWNIYRDDQGLYANQIDVQQSGEEQLTLRIARRDKQPLLCPGDGPET